MSLDLNAPARLEIPEARRKPVWPWLVAGLLIAGAGFGAWSAGLRPSRLWAQRSADLTFVNVDEGELDVYVTENGSLESGNNATVYCKVEALMGQIGGAQGATVGAGGMRTGGSMAGPAGAGQAGGQQQGAQAAQPAPAKKAVSKGAGAAKASVAAATSKAKAASSTAATDTTATTTASSGGRGGGAGGGMAVTPSAAAATTTTVMQRPVIKSFTMVVMRHTPLRPATKAAPVQQKTQVMDPMGGGGRGGRGGGRRGGGGNMMEEKPGATRIIWILPEGTRVKTGDKVCEFDASSFTAEVDAQKIRHLQAKSWVDQATSMLEVAEMSLEEYRDGVYPQDRQQIIDYIKMCRFEAERAKRNFEWSKDIYLNKALRAKSQVEADGMTYQQSMISLNQAERMLERLDKYTKPKLIKSLEANVAAIRADLLSQKASFGLEDDRLKRLNKMVENCTLLAPRDGIVVYVNQSNGWGSNEVQIQEGATVREGQPIFSVPDPRNMQVKAKINESKVALIHAGQPALIRVDAFPDRLMRGTVGEVTAIPAPMNRMSDVKIYFATVTIAKGFDGLRPGLSAEVDFQCETRPQVIRVPLQAIRKVGGQSFAALKLPTAPESGPPWKWVKIEVGMSNPSFAEVTSGLKPGDQVVSRPDTLLPAPTPVASPVQTALKGS